MWAYPFLDVSIEVKKGGDINWADHVLEPVSPEY